MYTTVSKHWGIKRKQTVPGYSIKRVTRFKKLQNFLFPFDYICSLPSIR